MKANIPDIIKLFFLIGGAPITQILADDVKGSLGSINTDGPNSREQGVRRRQQNHVRTKRRMQTEPHPIAMRIVHDKYHHEQKFVEIFDPTNNEFSIIKGPPDIQKELLEKIENGELKCTDDTLMKEGAYFDYDGSFVLPDLDGVEYGSVDNNSTNRKLASTTGVKTMLVVRIVALDSSTTSSEEELSDSWFGTNGDPVNLKSQFEACSYNKLSINSDIGAVGVTTVNLDMNITGVASTTVQWAAVDALGTFSNQYDHVMLCIPPGTRGRWLAYAYLNSWLSVYNDDWCNSVSTQMHEIGHNMDLLHSGESQAYDDQSGMMGYSYSSSNWPVMCFNAPKGFQLNWYSDRHTIVSQSWSGKLYGIADYGSTVDGDTVIIQIPAEEDWYVSFNRKIGINKDTIEGKNQVLVHKRRKGLEAAGSSLVAKLNGGDTFNGGPLLIQVKSISSSELKKYASVTIGQLPIPSPCPTCATSSSPSTHPSSIPTFISVSKESDAPSLSQPESASPTLVPSSKDSEFPSPTPTITPTSHAPNLGDILFETRIGAFCPKGKEVTQDECYDAILQTTTSTSKIMPHLQVGSWSYTPCGCFSFDTGRKLWTDYKNPDFGSCKQHPHAKLVCRKESKALPPIKKGDFELMQKGKAGACPKGLSLAQDECYNASLKFVKGMNVVTPSLNVGTWEYTPCGCFIYNLFDKYLFIDYKDSIHGNCLPQRHSNLVCKKKVTTPLLQMSDLILYEQGNGGICPIGKEIAEEECFKAGLKFTKKRMELLRYRLILGTWTFSPCGCFIYNTLVNGPVTINYKDPSHGNCRSHSSSNLVCKK